MNLVFTNGCFDALHAGHLHLLTEARAQGDRLFVALNSDDSVYRLKGRCIHHVADRRAMLEELRCVDEVDVFDDEWQLLAMIRRLRPAVLVKGHESGRPIPGAEYAGRVHLVERLPGRSTTDTIRRLQAAKPFNRLQN